MRPECPGLSCREVKIGELKINIQTTNTGLYAVFYKNHAHYVRALSLENCWMRPACPGLFCREVKVGELKINIQTTNIGLYAVFYKNISTPLPCPAFILRFSCAFVRIGPGTAVLLHRDHCCWPCGKVGPLYSESFRVSWCSVNNSSLVTVTQAEDTLTSLASKEHSD